MFYFSEKHLSFICTRVKALSAKKNRFPYILVLRFLKFKLMHVSFSDVLNPSQTHNVSIGIDFRDTTQPANFDIWYYFSIDHLFWILTCIQFTCCRWCTLIIYLITHLNLHEGVFNLNKRYMSCFSTLTNKFSVILKPPIGELMQKNPMSQSEFIIEKGIEMFLFVLFFIES